MPAALPPASTTRRGINPSTFMGASFAAGSGLEERVSLNERNITNLKNVIDLRKINTGKFLKPEDEENLEERLVNIAEPDFLQGLRELCDKKGLLLIVDEIQTGLGRTGEWFGFHHAGIQPDIVTMAKGMANGVPIGAVWAVSAVAEAFQPGDHGSTFAGQPLAASAARETLKVLEEIQAPMLAKTKGEEMIAAITKIEGVDSVRGLGLLLGVEIEKESLEHGDSRDLAKACLSEGLVVNAVTPTALRLAPPLTISSEEIIEGADILQKVLLMRRKSAS